jgi:hypothetical protein
MACSPVLSSMCHSGSGGSGMADAEMLSQDVAALTLTRDLRDLRRAQRSSACSPRLPRIARQAGASYPPAGPLGGVERPGRVDALRAFDSRPGRVLGGPAVRAACCGNLKPALVVTQRGRQDKAAGPQGRERAVGRRLGRQVRCRATMATAAPSGGCGRSHSDVIVGCIVWSTTASSSAASASRSTCSRNRAANASTVRAAS